MHNKNLLVLELCSKSLRVKLLRNNPWIKDVALLTTPKFEQMSRSNRYELWKNTVICNFNKLCSTQNEVELLTIFNYFDLLIYQDRIVDLCPGIDFLEPLNFVYDKNDIEKITCAEDFVDRATLIIEDKRIHVKSFILTDNSPVFKTMFHSISFKEGQTKTIELPGKSLDEIVYFIKHVQYPNLYIDGKYLMSHVFISVFYKDIKIHKPSVFLLKP